MQYATTSDGVSIAHWTLGEGAPLVALPQVPFSHIQLEWQIPEFRAWHERLAERNLLIRYDGRGHGMSTREVADLSLEAHESDIDAVVGALGIDRFALFAGLHAVPIAITYAARHPERITHVILWCGWSRAADYFDTPVTRTLVSLRDKDWETYTETVAHSFAGWSEGSEANHFASLMRECVTQEMAQKTLKVAQHVDVTGLLPAIQSPALVMHRRQIRILDFEIARGLASQILGAQLAVLEGDSAVPFVGDMEAVASTIDGFLGHAETDRPQPAHAPEGTAVILFADIADSTALTERLGDTAFRERARVLEETLRTTVRNFGGTAVEGRLLGDGVLALFPSARQAIAAARPSQQAGSKVGLDLHIGLHAGDVMHEANDVYGGAVNIAARISDASAPGEVLVSQTVRDLARTSAGVSFDDRGEQLLKGVSEPMRLFEVRWRE
jgi:class 3 adenylate cyclase/pimeloyl-ACP methyl ester carboxylesterase